MFTLVMFVEDDGKEETGTLVTDFMITVGTTDIVEGNKTVVRLSQHEVVGHDLSSPMIVKVVLV